MILGYFQFMESIIWRLGIDDGLLFALPKTTDLRLVTPLLYQQLLRTNQDYYHALENGKYFCKVSQIILATESDQTIEAVKSDKGPSEIVKELLLRLRLVGGQ